MQRRADKHLARQDDTLVRAITRVWKARERGRLLERVRALRLLKSAWSTWRDRMGQMHQLQGSRETSLITWPSSHIAFRLCYCIFYAIQFISCSIWPTGMAPGVHHLSEPSPFRRAASFDSCSICCTSHMARKVTCQTQVAEAFKDRR